MSSFSALKTAIQAAIKQNGNNEITGDILQDILLSIVSTLGDSAINTLEQGLQTESQTRGNDDAALSQAIENEATARGNADTALGNLITGIKNNIDNGYVYAGIATPSTTPVSGKVFYIATQAGTYTNLGNTAVKPGMSILKYNGSAWSNEQVIYTDGGVFDLSAYNAVGGVLATYADLSAALTALNALDSVYKQPGMSFKFVQTSDNKYVQYRLMADEFTTDVTQWAVNDVGVYMENPEYINVKLDGSGKVLEGFRGNGSKVVVPDVDILGNLRIAGANYLLVSNSEFLAAWLDANNRVLFGFRRNGQTYIGDANFLKILSNLKDSINNINSILYFVQNPELLQVEIDGANNVLSERKKDGRKVEYVGLDVPNLRLDGTDIKTIEDLEKRLEIKLDANNRIISYRREDGTIVENVGTETQYIVIDRTSIKNISDVESRLEVKTDATNKVLSYREKDGTLVEMTGIRTPKLATESFTLPEDTKKEVAEIASSSINIKKYNLPTFGTVNLVSEKFYLTSNEGYSDITGVYLIRDYEDTTQNAADKKTLDYYYVKSSLIDNGDGTYSKYDNPQSGENIKLDFYAASKVTKVEDSYYVTSTLTEVIDPETGEITGYEVNENSIEVTEVVDVPPIGAWSVDKKTEHYCQVGFDFGDYLRGVYSVGVKYQGSSTLLLRKRNFRLTFYKNDTFAKKNKLKIGEMVRLSGYNLKANFNDNTRIKEQLMNLIFMAMWESKERFKDYPWDNEDTPFTGATGMIKGFPVQVSIGNQFYGLDIFGLKKDGKNYLLDKDEDGMFESGSSNENDCWTDAQPVEWEDELNDEEDWVIDNQTQSNYDALTTFFDFINGRLEISGDTIPFDKTTMPERMSIVDWIDYLICLQVFAMSDNTCRNLILYTASDKKKFYPFFYDLDLSWRFNAENYTADIMIPKGEEGAISFAGDMSLWQNFKDEWWDEIVNRYHELRTNVLSMTFIKTIATSILNGIPDDVYAKESARWQSSVHKDNMNRLLELLEMRLNYLDTEYYK